MRTYILLLALGAACADIPADATAAPVGSSSPLGATVQDDARSPVVLDAGAALVEIQPPAALPLEIDPHDLWFGDSGWDCCTRPLCVWLCDDGDTPVEGPTGMRVCCVPDVQQCDDLDGGL